MEFKVREVTPVEEKSQQQVEQELLEKHEQEQNNELVEETNVENTETQQEKTNTQPSELKEEDVLSFIKNRYNKEITSVDQLFTEREDSEELPEDVAAYFDYKKKTGRGIEDYVKLNRDFSSMNEDQLLKEYLLATGEAIDNEDVEVLMEDFSYDEELDDEKDIKKIKLRKKKSIAKAQKFFEEQKEMYKQPLESSTVGISKEDQEELEAYKQYLNTAKTQQEEVQRKRDWFVKKTNEVFQDFKGFEFKVGDTSLTYNPGNVNDIKETQMDTNNFIKKFLDDQGLIKDAAGYHKSLAIAMNPERFAKFFYEQGKSDATEDVARKMKNINMTERRAPEVARSKDGLQIRALNPSEGRGLKIKSKK
jgi:hypothetical protein